METECLEQAKHIALRIEAIVAGDLYYCDGDYLEEEEAIQWYLKENPDETREDAELEIENYQANLWEYLGDNLGVEYRIDEHKEYRSVQVCVTWGGPSIYVDTGEGEVICYWGAKASYSLNREAIEAIDELFEEEYNCL